MWKRFRGSLRRPLKTGEVRVQGLLEVIKRLTNMANRAKAGESGEADLRTCASTAPGDD
jgi:hypothetical protein